MGRPTSKKNIGLGRSLLNERHRSGGMSIHSNKHALDADNSYGSNARLKSVTQEKALDEFLSTAELADTDFTAERMNVKIVASDQVNPYLLTPEQEAARGRKQDELRQSLTVPRRPTWDEDTTPQQLDRNEKEAFLEWRRHLAQLQEQNDLLLTPFERNLEVWRQLWRVIERSDLVVQIVDARDPLLFRSRDLERYVKELDRRKRNLLLVNKADLMTVRQRRHWAQYFKDNGVRFSFFSAFLAKEEREKQQKLLGTPAGVNVATMTDDPIEEEDEDELGSAERDDDVDDENEFGSDEDEDVIGEEVEIVDDSADEDDDETDASDDIVTSLAQEAAQIRLEARKSKESSATTVEVDDLRILSVDELEDLFLSEAPEVLPDEQGRVRKTHIGLVGYPNVGKSSTINALVGSKTVSVSATPGKTKHFQTIQLSDSVTLVDCPGLVFPNFASTQADLVCAGVLPIDQLREFTGPVALVARRIPMSFLEAVYGIHIHVRATEEGGTGVPTAEELLISYALSRGFTKSGQGNPDESRAARYILKDYVNGKLLFVTPPPTSPPIDGADFNAELHDIQAAAAVDKKRAPLSHVPKYASTYVPTTADLSLTPTSATADGSDGAERPAGAGVLVRPSVRGSQLDAQFFTAESRREARARSHLLGSKAVTSANGKVVMFPYQNRLNDDASMRSTTSLASVDSSNSAGVGSKMLTGRKAREMAALEAGLDPADKSISSASAAGSGNGKKHFKGGNKGNTKRATRGY